MLFLGGLKAFKGAELSDPPLLLLDVLEGLHLNLEAQTLHPQTLNGSFETPKS